MKLESLKGYDPRFCIPSVNGRQIWRVHTVWPEFAFGGHILGNFGGGVAGK